MAAPCESTAMVDGRFYAPHPTAFTVTKSYTWMGAGFAVKNVADGAAVMQVETAHLGYRNLRSLHFHDATSRQPVIAVELLGMGARRRWEAFRGDGATGSDRLFVAVNKTRLFQTGCTVHVFLDGNSSGERTPDFVVHGNYYDRGAMTVCRGHGDGDDKEEIAQIVREKENRNSLWKWNSSRSNECTVRINPGVDQAFVLALTVIFDQIHQRTYCSCRCVHSCQSIRVQRH